LRVVLLSRVAHGLVALGFLACIALVYLGAWEARVDAATVVALALLAVEGTLVLVSRGDCPLTPFLRRLGDDTPLFELVLPPRAAKQAVPVLGTVTALGAVLLAARMA
jgi:hypothetical protein